MSVIPSMKILVKNQFKGKKVTVMGLGLLGGLLNDIRYLADQGADLLVTDLKSKEELKSSLDQLKKYKKIKYVLGKHRLADFKNRDLILQPGNVPIDSPYLTLARKNKIPVYVGESLFAEYASDVTMIGITGTRGKSTVTQLVYEILKLNYELGLNQAAQKKNRLVGQKGFLGKPFLAGNVKGVSTLALLDQVKPGDLVVMELDSWALHGMGEIQKSPQIAVFTNFMSDHLNYYRGDMDKYFADKANIFLYQKEGDQLVLGQGVLKLLQTKKQRKHSARAIVPDLAVVPRSWRIRLLGEHNRQNIAYAVTVARLLDIPEKTIKRAVEAYRGLPGRLELIRAVRGVAYYNDTNATTPDGVLAALAALRSQVKPGAGIVLISGGTDKGLDYTAYAKIVSKEVKTLILFKGTATEKILNQLKVQKVKKSKNPVMVVDSMGKAMDLARNFALKNDIVLLSPGAASFGVFKNEYDRGEQFVKLVESMK